jgi:hypothetical protein
MADQKQLQLVERLHERTIKSRVPWQDTSEEEVYQVSFAAGYSVQITERGAEQDTGLEYVLTITNEEGDIVDEFSDSDFDEIHEDKRASELMRETFRRARKVAQGSDRAIDAILDELARS